MIIYNNNNIFISYIKYTNITLPANSKANNKIIEAGGVWTA